MPLRRRYAAKTNTSLTQRGIRAAGVLRAIVEDVNLRLPLSLAAVALAVTACGSADAPAPAAASSTAITLPTETSSAAGTPDPSLDEATPAPSADSSSMGSSSAETSPEPPASSSASTPGTPAPASTPECPSQSSASVVVKAGDVFTSTPNVNASAGEGMSIFIDSDVEFSYRIMGTTIEGKLPSGQQALCFALDAGSYAFLSGEKKLLDINVQ